MEKVLFLISSIKDDGPNRVLENMIYGLDKKKYQIYVLSFLNSNKKENIDKLKKYGSEVLCLNFRKKSDIILKGKKELSKVIHNINPDIVHSHGVLPDIVNAQVKSKKKITTLHNNMYEDYIYAFGKIKGHLIILWHLHYLKRFNCCVCCSKSIYEVMSKKIKNCTYIQNAIYKFEKIEKYDFFRKEIRNQYSIPLDAIVYIYVGVLSNRKNVLNMAKSFNYTLEDNEYLLVLGDGILSDEFDSLVDNRRIIRCGFKKNVIEYLCASDVYCSFSLSEGFSISVLESLECNNLLLLYNIPSHKEIFEIEPDIYLGEIFDEADFFEKKKSVVKHLEKSIDTSIILKEKLNFKHMMKLYEKVYEEERR